MSKSQTFYIDASSDEEQTNKEVTAAGVLIYKFVKNSMHILMADTRGTFEDLGGRADKKDKDIYSTAAREANEESNNILNKRKLKNRIKNAPYVYLEKSKYVVYFIKANEEEENLIESDFGDIEIHDNIKRKIRWFPVEKIIFEKLHFRIKNKRVFDMLKSIKSDNAINIGIFEKP